MGRWRLACISPIVAILTEVTFPHVHRRIGLQYKCWEGRQEKRRRRRIKCKLTATFWADYTRGEQGEFCATSVKRSLESWVVVHLVKENSTPFSADKWTNALLFSSVSMPLLSFIKMGEKMSRCEWKQLTSQGAFDSLLILLPHKTRKRENQTTLVTMPATLGLPPLHKKGAGFQWRMEYNNLQVVTPIDANCWMQKAGVFICSHDCIGFGLLTARKGDFIEKLK